MDFESAQKYLEYFVSYEKVRDFGYDEKAFDLERLRIFLREYGVDLASFKYFHVGGSKGKGSVCKIVHDYILEACAKASEPALSGKVGLFMSPHVVSICERIVVDGEMISEEQFAALVAELRDFLEKRGDLRDLKPTWFEILFVLALKYFADVGCEYVILEVGMGGRLDATNVVMPLVSVLTSLELEHQDVLGDSLEKIFAEKWGIKKTGVPMVVNEGMREFVENKLNNNDCDLAEVFFASDNESAAKLALLKAGFVIDEELWRSVLRNFKLIGRYDLRVVDGKSVMFDIAHTVKSIERLIERLNVDFSEREKVFVWGVLKDKDVEGIRKLFEDAGRVGARVVFVGGFSERALSGEDYKEAFSRELRDLKKDQLMVVTGSSYLVGKILSNL